MCEMLCDAVNVKCILLFDIGLLCLIICPIVLIREVPQSLWAGGDQAIFYRRLFLHFRGFIHFYVFLLVRLEESGTLGFFEKLKIEES